MRSNRAFGGILACYLLVFFGLCLLEAAPKYAAWSDPVNLGPVVNSGFDELLPAISDDELSLFFVSTRPGFGGTDIWVSQRAKKSSPWGIPMNLGSSINTSHNERGVGFSRDGHFMFLVSDRPGGLGGFDIWVSRRIHVNDDFGLQPPVNLGQAVNSSSNDAGPNYFQDDYSGATHLYLASNRPGGLGSYDIYVSALLVNGWFGQAVLVTELSSAQNDLRPAIRQDGLEIFLNSNRFEGIGDMDLWSADRQTVADFWSQPENLGPAVNSNSVDSFPSLSSDGQTLFFNSDRLDPDSSGGLDLYVITRSKAK